MTHVITRISGDFNDDWIAEGIAEYYGIELLYRAGGYDAEQRAGILADLAEWGLGADELRARQSSGPITARAVLVFDALDKEIREETDGDETLDAVTRRLMVKRRISLDDLREAFEDVTGDASRVLADLD
jgi:predicted metalloprotease with PDZ domain